MGTGGLRWYKEQALAQEVEKLVIIIRGNLDGHKNCTPVLWPGCVRAGLKTKRHS